MKRVAMPTDSRARSGTSSTISEVTRWNPRGRGRNSICFWIHTPPILARTAKRTYGGRSPQGLVHIGQRRSMDPPLRERLRWRNASENSVEAPAVRAMMARTAALLAGATAVVCLVGVLVPGEAQLDD